MVLKGVVYASMKNAAVMSRGGKQFLSLVWLWRVEVGYVGNILADSCAYPFRDPDHYQSEKPPNYDAKNRESAHYERFHHRAPP